MNHDYIMAHEVKACRSLGICIPAHIHREVSYIWITLDIAQVGSTRLCGCDFVNMHGRLYE